MPINIKGTKNVYSHHYNILHQAELPAYLVGLFAILYSEKKGKNLINANQLYKSRYDSFEEETNVPILFRNRLINFADK